MRIPEIQNRLRDLAKETGLEELSALADSLSRRKPKRQGNVASTPMSDDLRERIREMAMANPDLPQSRIAAAFNVNPGRVSESIAGFRG